MCHSLTDDEQMDAVMTNLAPVGAQIAELHAKYGTPAGSHATDHHGECPSWCIACRQERREGEAPVATIAPITLDALALAAVLSRNDVALAAAVIVGSALHRTLDTSLAEVRGALSATEIAEVERLAMSRDADTVEKRRARHSRDAFADAIKDAAAYIRDRLQHGDHVQQAQRLATPVRAVRAILMAAAGAGSIESAEINAVDDEDLQMRVFELLDAGAVSQGDEAFDTCNGVVRRATVRHGSTWIVVRTTRTVFKPRAVTS